MSRGIRRVQQWWAAEASRHFLWLPVCFGAGIATYFSLPLEPLPYLLPALAAGAFLACLLWWRRAQPVLLAVLLFTLGTAWANLTTLREQPVMLGEGLTSRPLTGVVRDIELTEHGVRLTLGQVTVDDLPPERTPQQVRLSVRLKRDAAFELPPIGAGIAIRAGLLPPMGPALPGGFDFARYFYFRDIGAIGYGLPPWQVLGPSEDADMQDDFWSWRVGLTKRIVGQLGPETGSIAAGLITGDARSISEEDFRALRSSNLYHIIAISGEHMAIISGVIFIALRLLALLLPRGIGLRPEMKSAAAVLTLLLVSAYLFVTGLPVSAVRAYIMIVLVLLAIIFRRQVDPMRSLAIAALLMLAYDPATLLEPGFRLSFAATLAIVALVESRVLVAPPMIERGPMRNATRWLITLLLVSVVAEAATMPFAVAMFNNLSPYGVLANSIATPLVSLVLMPLVALFFLLLPLGLEDVALQLLHYGILALLGLARWISSLPHAALFLPSIPGYGLALVSIGLAWVCLWQSRVRRLGFIPMLLGVASLALVQLPDMVVGGSLKQVALRTPDGYALARGRPDSMVPELWANGLGYRMLPEADNPYWRCDTLGCVARIDDTRIALPKDGAAIEEDCRLSDVVLSPLAGARCGAAGTLIGSDDLREGSVVALWLKDGAIPRVETSVDWQGTRPWSIVVNDEDSGAE